MVYTFIDSQKCTHIHLNFPYFYLLQMYVSLVLLHIWWSLKKLEFELCVVSCITLSCGNGRVVYVDDTVIDVEVQCKPSQLEGDVPTFSNEISYLQLGSILFCHELVFFAQIV